MEKSAVKTILENILPNNIATLISSYVDARCTLCVERKGIMVKDGGGEWQIWCLTCALQLLPEGRPRVNRLNLAPLSHSYGSGREGSAF
jgi:hypothetical protein